MDSDNYLKKISEDSRVVGLESFFKELISSKNIPLRKISERCGTPHRSFMNYLGGTRTLPLGICKQIIREISRDNREYQELIQKLFENIKYIKSICSHSKPAKMPKALDKNLAYLIGAMHDGCVFSNPKKNQYLNLFKFIDEIGKFSKHPLKRMKIKRISS